MTGVSYMIPFVAAGGLLIALGFLFGGYEIVGAVRRDRRSTTRSSTCPTRQALGLDHALFDSGFFAYLGALFFIIGKTAFIFFVPALAGYIAYAIADRPGIAPGFVMGGLAANVFNVQTSTAGRPPGRPASSARIIGGVLAGVVAHWIAGWKVPAWARGLMPVLVIPLLDLLICRPRDDRRARQAASAGLMDAARGRPEQHERRRTPSCSACVLGLMMAFDMGGPLNKVAYSFAAAGVGAAASATRRRPRAARSWPR